MTKKTILFYLLIFVTPVWAQPIVEKVEPPFWWTGMHNTSLQLMVYGNNISEYTPCINSKGIKLVSAAKVNSPNYLFLDLTIGPKAKPGNFGIKFENNGKFETYKYSLIRRDEGSSDRQGFSNKDVMYLITPDRFANGNPENDNHPDMIEQVDRSFQDGRHGGDIEGIANHLEYLKNLGYTAIWVNPVLENNQETFSYHGYSTTDYYKVDPRFGSNEEYKSLSEKAGALGIKMIMDMIVNHCGSGHWWMKDLPTEDWINFGNNFVPTNHQKPTIQDPYKSDYDYKQMVDGWFVETMPDLNLKNPYLATYLIQNAIWWIEYASLDGIRMDTYSYSDMDFMRNWTCSIMNEYPDFNITGEEWSENPNIVAHWQQGKINSNGYTSCLPSMIDFPMQSALRKSLINGNFIDLYAMQANDFIYADPDKFVVFPDNHDMDRFFTQVNENLGLFKMGIAHVLTTRGTPQIYYGTEILFTNSTPGHGLIRQDYPGGWHGDSVNAFTDKGLTDQQINARQFMSKLMNWRKEKDVIHSGKLLHFVPADNMYVYFRTNSSEIVMVVLNLNQGHSTLILSRFKEILSGVNEGINVVNGENILLDRELSVPGNAPLIIEIHR